MVIYRNHLNKKNIFPRDYLPLFILFLFILYYLTFFYTSLFLYFSSITINHIQSIFKAIFLS